MASDAVRLQCLRASLRKIPWAKVSDWEIKHRGPSYSMMTALHWRKTHPRIGLDWILGSDQWKQIRSWRNYRKLGKLVRFLVFPRPDVPKPIRGLRMLIVPFRFDLSASYIRQRLRKKQGIQGMVLPEVEKIIRQSRSYYS